MHTHTPTHTQTRTHTHTHTEKKVTSHIGILAPTYMQIFMSKLETESAVIVIIIDCFYICPLLSRLTVLVSHVTLNE